MPRPEALKAPVAAGQALAGALCAGYAALGLSLLPFLPQQLEYLTSLETGNYVGRELAHPLFVPTLELGRWLVALAGRRGCLMLPVEVFNVLVSLGVVWLLARLARRAGADPLSSLLGAVLFATSIGFWTACLRVDPYALAAAAAVLSLSLLVTAPATGGGALLWAGAAAGLSVGYHFSSVALAPVVALFAWRDAGGGRRGLGSAAAALGAMALAAAACYAVWLLRNGLAPLADLRVPARAFHAVSSLPMTSWWETRSAAAQLKGFASSLRFQSGRLLAVAALMAALGGWRAAAASPAARRLLAAAGLAAASYGVFFAVNNDQNGFIFIGSALLALVPALLASTSPVRRLAFAALTAWAAAAGGRQMLEHPGRNTKDPLYREVRYLEAAARPGDVFIMPGCPFNEIFHHADLDMLWVGPEAAARGRCAAPFVPVGDELASRLRWYLERGRAVYWLEGDLDAEFPARDYGPQMMRQLFWVEDVSREKRRAEVRDARAWLERGFELKAPLVSSAGREYRGLALKPRAALPKAGPEPLLAGDPRRLRADKRLAVEAEWEGAHLERVYARDPSDPYARWDLARWYVRYECPADGPGGKGPELLDAPAMRRMEKAMVLFVEGKAEEGAAESKKALGEASPEVRRAIEDCRCFRAEACAAWRKAGGPG